MLRPFSILSVLLVFALLCSSCVIGAKAREERTQAWIVNAKKPIQVLPHDTTDHLMSTLSNKYYTLIDSDGRVYLANGVRFVLPKVIE